MPHHSCFTPGNAIYHVLSFTFLCCSSRRNWRHIQNSSNKKTQTLHWLTHTLLISVANVCSVSGDLSATIIRLLNFLLIRKISAAITSLNIITLFGLHFSIFLYFDMLSNVSITYPYSKALRGFIIRSNAQYNIQVNLKTVSQKLCSFISFPLIPAYRRPHWSKREIHLPEILGNHPIITT